MRQWLLVAVVALVGCVAPITTDLVTIDTEGWSRGQGVEIVVPNSDTLSLCDLLLVARSDTNYDFDSLALTISVKAPDGSQTLLRTTLLGDPESEHTNMREWEQPLVGGARLSQEGDYIFRFTHSATRTVEGLWALGITRREIN